MLAERQTEFARAILNPVLPVPAGIACPYRSDRTQRFAVYRNNVAVGLIETLRSNFPVVNRLVGDAFFAAMARRYAMGSPPALPMLLAYGGAFPSFVAGFQPAASMPYLAEVARLEWLWLEAYHAADTHPLAIEALQLLPAERLPELRLTLHPSTRFARFAHPSLTIWRMHEDDREPAPTELADTPEQVLIVRPWMEVQTLGITPGALAFLETVHRGGTIAEAVEAVLVAEPSAAIAEILSLLFDAGAFSAGAYEGLAVTARRRDHP